MGARQSKRSVDITTTPKKEGIPAEGGVVGDAAAPGDGKLERIEEADTKPTTNGIAPHTDAAEDKEKDKDEATEKDKEQQQQEEVKAEEAKQESIGESLAEVAEVTTPTEATPASPNAAASPDSKETKKKDKKKKWSFRSISFSKKDKTKPNREETRKNGDVSMDGNMSVQEPLAEGGEEAESATAAACSSVEESAEKSAASSPSADEQIAASVAAALTVSATTEPKEEVAAASPTTAAAYLNPAEEKKEEPTPSAPTPVPSVEDKKEEAVEKVEAVEKKVVEVSPAGGRSVADPIRVPVFRVQPVTTPSIIERKASEDLPSLPPSSPPPTPIDPSPLQQARQAAASATALAEALKLPAEAADKEDSTAIPPDAFPPPRDQVPRENRVEPIPASASPKSPSLSADLPSPTAATFVPARVEYPAVVEAEIESRDLVVKEEGQTLASNRDNEAAEIDLKIESASKSPVAMAEVSERRKSETHRVEEARPTTERDTTKRLDESLDGKNTQSEAVVKAEVECPLIIPKEVDPFVNDDVKKVHACEGLSAIGSELECSENKPLDQSLIDHSDGKVEMKLLSMVTHEMEVPDVVTTDKVMNDTLPVVECQINSEINSCEGAMKTNVSPNAGHNEKVEAGTLPSTEIEINSASPAIKQHFSSENFGTEKMSFSNETAQGVESIGKLSDSDIVSSAEKYVIVETDESSEVVPTASAGQENLSKNLKQMSVGAEVTEQQKTIEPEHDYAKEDVKEETTASVIPPTKTESIVTTVNEIFINSEEGPLSVSDIADVLVEAKMAMVIPEEDSVEELTDTTESIKVIPETDEEKVENEPESDTALPTEETLISEELEDTSVPEDAPIVEPLNDIKTVDAEDMLPPPPPPEDTVIVSSQISESPSIVDTFETESIITTDEPVLVFSTTIEAEPVIISPSKIEQIEDLESGTSPKLVSHLVEREGHIEKSFKHELHEASMFLPPVFQFYDIPPYHFSSDTNQSSESQMLVLPEPVFENMPIPTDVDLSSLPELEDREVPSLECCPSGFPDAPVFEPPAAIEHAAASPRDLTEALLTPPVSPNSQSNVSIASGIATTAKDRPYTLTRAEDDRNDREPTGGSASLRESTSYGRLDAELERLAAECLAKIECQEEALSVCQLSTTALSAAAQEHHQSVPEAEAPVENNVAHESSTTESVDEAPKVAPPAIPTEPPPASPPTAPAITEDVASVTKAIEEIDISDKAVAAAVNECNTSEIIADACHQNNINEYE